MTGVVVLDYGSGNLASAERALRRTGADVVVTSDFDVALNADALVVPGVGEWPGTVERLQAPIVPHMGWNTVMPGAGSVLFDGLDPRTRFYFVHSYAVRTWELEVSGPFTAPVVTWAEHGGDRFVAAVENGPLSATQFHPEKSGDAGAEVL